LKLIIVESPAKARTIERFLGEGYVVAASYGHIRDLPSRASEIPARFRKKEWARLGVDVDDDFQPIYVVPPDSKKHVTELKKLVKKADELLLATDEDREGEAISWHLLEVLEPDVPVRRITFHEITRGAIEQALASPREVDLQRVRAQESRRILDRLYGYTLSPVLWKKIRTKLSAGRVQSVAVRLIVEREEERQAFVQAEYYDVEALLVGAGGLHFTARLTEVDGVKIAGGKDFDPDTGKLKHPDRRVCLDAAAADEMQHRARVCLPWQVVKVERKETRQRPAPPFTTSTLQQAASNRLKLSPQRTMQIAQRLYEGVDLGGGRREGLITYMRTDSLTLSERALSETESFVAKEYGAPFTDGPRRYRTKSKGAQEAHEAIRPTSVARTPASLEGRLDSRDLAVYRLIWNRTVASQMADARLDKTAVDLEVACDGRSLLFRANGSIVTFPGHLRVYGDIDKDTQLPELKEGDRIPAPDAPADEEPPQGVAEVRALRHETQPPARYTEASLIKKLEEEGIGRPSTYAPIIGTIQQRDYVVKKSGSLLPTYVGMAVVHLLRDHFPRYVDLKFTAQMEEQLDEIARGDLDSLSFLRDFYLGAGGGDDPGLVNRIDEEMPRIGFPAVPVGKDPETGEDVLVRIGRNFVYVQVGQDDEKRATLPVDLLIDELDTAKALELVEQRRKAQEPIGQHPETGQNIYALVGPFGPYLQLGENDGDTKPKRVSLGRGTDPTAVDLDLALKLLSLPREIGTDPETGKPVRAGLGRYGPYVERDRVFASVDSAEQLFTITLDQALERIRNKNRKPVLKELGAHPETGKPLQVLKGRYGPYVTDGKVNATIEKGRDPQEVTLEEAVALLATAATRKQTTRKTTRKTGKKKTTRKKTAKKAAKKSAKKTGQKGAGT